MFSETEGQEDEPHRSFTGSIFGKIVTLAAVTVFTGLATVMLTAGDARDTGWAFTSSDIFGDASGNKALALDADAPPIVETMRENYPEDYEQLADLGDDLAGRGEDRHRIAHAKARYLDRFGQRIATTIRYADTPDLLAVRDQTIELVESIGAQSAHACAGFFNGRDTAIAPTDEVRARIGRSVAARIDAAASGRDRPVARLAVDRADLAAHSHAMLGAGATAEQVRALKSGRMQSLSAREQCHTGLAIWRGTRALPDETAARVVVLLLQTPLA